ncbi:MAG: 2,3-bisphosphoglycerate-independent phosphoglycerate mutase [Nitrospinae bacterium]|nr:2,3-bisphosphoglycerate-independent phosphoglycerate mutase [Nitrospinota bacterium]
MNNNGYQPVLLCILDGWGHTDTVKGNALKAAKMPVFDYLEKEFPPIFINASGEAVGLPEGQMGNSEVGHLNIGAGRVIRQELPRINHAIKDGYFFKNPVIDHAVKKAKADGTKYHLIGLLSDGGVHSHIEHLIAFLQKAKSEGLDRVYVHALMDGRDTSPTSGAGYMRQLLEAIKETGCGRVATVIGRYYGMDRDNRWDRVEKAFDAMALGEAEKRGRDPVKAIEESYAAGVTDEFIKPTVMTDEAGAPVATIDDGDVVQFFNFRSDRVREMVKALIDPDFQHFARKKTPRVHVCSLTEYSKEFTLPVAFENHPLAGTLGEVLAQRGIAQFRTAETEKYAHVTFFFNGGVEKQFPGEERKLIPSPGVATYDLQPEMSADPVTDEVVHAVASGRFPAVIVNIANGDMVGHTGVFAAAVKAAETVDACVGRMMEAVKRGGGWMIITADHGNIEEMLDAKGNPMTQHSTNQVPFHVYGPRRLPLVRDGGALCDIAPTILKLMGVPQPPEMTGRPLVVI